MRTREPPRPATAERTAMRGHQLFIPPPRNRGMSPFTPHPPLAPITHAAGDCSARSFRMDFVRPGSTTLSPPKDEGIRPRSVLGKPFQLTTEEAGRAYDSGPQQTSVGIPPMSQDELLNENERLSVLLAAERAELRKERRRRTACEAELALMRREVCTIGFTRAHRLVRPAGVACCCPKLSLTGVVASDRTGARKLALRRSGVQRRQRAPKTVAGRRCQPVGLRQAHSAAPGCGRGQLGGSQVPCTGNGSKTVPTG
eukprot:3218407-Prymnesium_polylepis.1